MPALGDTVILHSTNGYDLPGLVTATADSWTSEMADMAERASLNPQPTGDQVYLLVGDPATGSVGITGPIGPGAGPGQWSLPA